jgi:hypothetical protein
MLYVQQLMILILKSTKNQGGYNRVVVTPQVFATS